MYSRKGDFTVIDNNDDPQSGTAELKACAVKIEKA